MTEESESAPNRVNGAQTPNGTARGGKLAEIRLAAGFLTILPVLPRADVTPETLAASFGWFPLVGFALGALLAAENLLLTTLFGDALAAVVLVLTLTVLTGAVHLDGLADSADALGAGTDRRRALEIMRDSRIGSFRHGRDFLFSRARNRRAGDDGRSTPHRGALACTGFGPLGDGGGWMAYRLFARSGRRNVAGSARRRSQSRTRRCDCCARRVANILVARAVGLCLGCGAGSPAARGVPAMARRRDGRSSRCGG